MDVPKDAALNGWLAGLACRNRRRSTNATTTMTTTAAPADPSTVGVSSSSVGPLELLSAAAPGGLLVGMALGVCEGRPSAGSTLMVALAVAALNACAAATSPLCVATVWMVRTSAPEAAAWVSFLALADASP